MRDLIKDTALVKESKKRKKKKEKEEREEQEKTQHPAGFKRTTS